MDILEVLKRMNFSEDEFGFFQHARYERPLLNQSKNHLSITVNTEKLLPLDLYRKLKEEFERVCGIAVNITIKAKDTKMDVLEIQNYIRYLSDSIQGGRIFNYVFCTLNDRVITLLFNSRQQMDRAVLLKEQLEALLLQCGIIDSLAFVVREPIAKQDITGHDTYELTAIGAISKPMRRIEIRGCIYKVEIRSFFARNNGRRKSGQVTQALIYVKDDTGVLLARRQIEEQDKDRLSTQFSKGDFVSVKGNVAMVILTNELELLIDEIEPIAKILCVKDEVIVKRVELHAHTKRSEMDGICETADLITRAFDWGHDAIAITDHMVVQSFPTAQNTVKKLLKNCPDRSFKVIYGIEMNMVDPDLNIVRNSDNRSLDCDYVVFDLETTGLSCRYDHIIEFGGVKIKKGIISDRLQFFINPEQKLSSFTIKLTNIQQEDVDKGLPLTNALERILEFFKDSVLVAQNASFDIGFINESLIKCGFNRLQNPVVDTLDLARFLNKERRRYRLGNIARYYKIDYDESVAHRADYDAEVTAQVFMRMLYIAQHGERDILTDVSQYNCETLDDLQKLNDADSFKKVNKKHVNLLALNQAGIKDLFKLVTLSHTDYLVVSGKANSKNSDDEYIAEPRILRSVINDKRKNLLIGSSCLNGEVFDAAATGSQADLEHAIDFYDYIEVQPPQNYTHLIEDHTIADQDHLLQILNNIIETAEKLGKIVVATGDVHYIDKQDKVLRDVYIQSQGIGGTIHPLYIFDKQRRLVSEAPDQHFRTTLEMLKCFDFLNTETAQRIVVENTRKIADRVEVAYPIKDRLYTPSIEGADEKLKEICYRNCRSLYGDPLPNLIEERLNKELSAIIKNGYGVIYYTAHLLVKKSNDEGYLVGSRGSVGSSFVATMANITEVNPLPAHYLCPNCHFSDFNVTADSGYDLPDKPCPRCKTIMHGEGQDIPFETFLGFKGDKVPDIDLNFSGDYQEKAHAYTKEIFGADSVFRAGTIGTVAEKTAFGYLKGYLETMHITRNLSQAEKIFMTSGCEGVKRTTGQHPGGIVVIPKEMDVHDFTPVQYPANNLASEWKTTHFEFEDIHDNILKLDILGHVDPTAMRLLERITGINVLKIPMNDTKTMSLFHSSKALDLVDSEFNEKTGAMGLPEFGTRFVRGILESTKPKYFSDLLRISGLSHGTDVWSNNARDLIKSGQTLQDVIGCRDDIMIYLMRKGLEPKDAFDIMESVRKGRGLKNSWKEKMKKHDVPDWYIGSCEKIKYMFPKAHAVAYVIMAVRIAWFKVYYPLHYYISYFTLRCNSFDIQTMQKGKFAIKARMDDIQTRYNDREQRKSVTNKELDLINTLEVASEMVARGYRFSNISLEFSLANEFVIDPRDDKALVPPFMTVDGLGYSVAKSIVDARNERPFLSQQDMMARSQISNALIKKLDEVGALEGLQEENQLQLF